jgi:hypothetical protein
MYSVMYSLASWSCSSRADGSERERSQKLQMQSGRFVQDDFIHFAFFKAASIARRMNSEVGTPVFSESLSRVAFCCSVT